jgi:5-amino-6-(5-phosphoribosylamino)uracil reductase
VAAAFHSTGSAPAATSTRTVPTRRRDDATSGCPTQRPGPSRLVTGALDSWRDAFAAFVERKTRAADAAVTPPYVTEIAAPDSTLVAVGNSWSTAHFDGPFYVTAAAAPLLTCSLVFVQSADGNTVTSNPSSLGGGETDHHVVYEGLSRIAADAVLAGAATVRGGQTIFSVWHPALVALRQSLHLPRHPIQVIATVRGVDISHGLLFNVPDVPVVMLTVPGGAAAMEKDLAERPWIRVVTMAHPGQLAQAFRRLREDFAISRLSCVGGRILATELLDLDLVDDVYLTTAPRPGGEAGTPMYSRRLNASVVVRKRGTAEESWVTFEHFHLRRDAAPS